MHRETQRGREKEMGQTGRQADRQDREREGRQFIIPQSPPLVM